jgi:hypothetical protein
MGIFGLLCTGAKGFWAGNFGIATGSEGLWTGIFGVGIVSKDFGAGTDGLGGSHKSMWKGIFGRLLGAGSVGFDNGFVGAGTGASRHC